MAAAVQLRIQVVAVHVHCYACNLSSYLPSATPDHASPLGAWILAHHDPRMIRVFASINDGPLQAHLLTPPRVLRP